MPIIFFALLGAILGSFAGAVSERIFTGRSWVSGRSACDVCGKTLKGRDLIPVLSWLLTLGHCRHCTARLSFRYVLIELVSALCFVLSYQMLGLSLALLFFLGAFTILLIIILYDLRHTIVPTSLSVCFGILSLIYFILTTSSGVEAGEVLMHAGIFGLAFLALHVFSHGRAMGLGDAPIVMSLSVLAGYQAFAGLLFSFWIGALVGIGILVSAPRGRRMGIEVPFVPFLALGFLLAIFSQWNPLAWIAFLMAHVLPA